MASGNLIGRGLDAVRTAPMGIALVGGEIIGSTTLVVLDDGPKISELPIITIGVLGLVVSGSLITKQFKLRHRLEETLERSGYDDRAFATTTNEWCARQTARVVLGQTGVLPQYEALCERRRDTAQLTWLPHI